MFVEDYIEKTDMKNTPMNFSDIKFIKLNAGVRYWEDVDVNGEEDADLDSAKEPIAPRMPFAIPTVKGEYEWEIIIDSETGYIVDWPIGTTAKVHYKTCDANVITFFTKDNEMIGKPLSCYVPSFLSIDDSGYGDYIILTIEENGHIKDFKFTCDDANEVIESAF